MYWTSSFQLCSPKEYLEEGTPNTMDISCAQSGLGHNARSQKRVAVELMGAVLYGPSSVRVSAVIHDISEAGARVKTSCDPALIQTPVELVVGERKFVADIRWRNEKEVGLSFLVELSAAEESEIHQLREILSRLLVV